MPSGRLRNATSIAGEDFQNYVSIHGVRLPPAIRHLTTIFGISVNENNESAFDP